MIKINCDLCGKVDERLNRALIEGVELNVCNDCSRFGKVLGSVKKFAKEHLRKEKLQEKEEKVELLVEDYHDIIKKGRELMGLSQKDFASRLNEKESVVHKIETGAFEPQLELAKRLEKILGVKLVEEIEEKHEPIKKKREEGFTIGDFIKTKK